MEEASGVAEGTAIGLYLVYAALALGLVVYLARTLKRNGAVFLVDVFDEDRLAEAVNHLLVIGFYLLNLGYAFLLYRLQPSYSSLTTAFNELFTRIAWLLLSLGVIHLMNMFVFWRIRTHNDRRPRGRHPYRPASASPPPPLTPPAPGPRPMAAASAPAPAPQPATLDQETPQPASPL